MSALRIAGVLLVGFLLLLLITHNDPESNGVSDPAGGDPDRPPAGVLLDGSTPVSSASQSTANESRPAAERSRPQGLQRDISAEDADERLVMLAAQSLEENKRADLLVATDQHDLEPGEFTFLEEMGKILQVEPDAVRVEFVDTQRVAFVAGGEVAALRKGSYCQFGLVQAIGHRYYDSILGAGNSAIVLSVITDAQWDDAVQAAQDQLHESTATEARQKIQQLRMQIESLEPEEWGMGKYARTATFVALQDDQLTLRKADGEQISVLIEWLDEESLQRAQARDRMLSRWRNQIRRLQRQHDLPVDEAEAP